LTCIVVIYFISNYCPSLASVSDDEIGKFVKCFAQIGMYDKRSYTFIYVYVIKRCVGALAII